MQNRKYGGLRMGSAVGNGEVSEFSINTYPTAFRHEVFLNNYLEHPDEMNTLLSILNTCQEDDDIRMYINSGGGSLSSVESLLHAMKNTKAHIHIVGSGEIASAATLPLFFADTYELSDDVSFMFHNASYGDWGNCQDMMEHSRFFYDKMVKMISRIYGGFFNDDEIEDIIVNKRQWYMDSDEFNMRYERLLSHRDKTTNDEYEGMIVLKLPDEKILNKMTKANIIRYLKGEVGLDENTGEVFNVEKEDN